MASKQKIIIVIFCLLLPLFLLLLSYKISLHFTELQPKQQQTIDFLQQDSGFTLNNQELTLNYTSAELSHLQDVKRVMNWADYTFYTLLLIILLMLSYQLIYLKTEKQQLYKAIFYGGITTIIATLLILIFSYFLFQSAFTIFHLLFFPQGNWTFPIDSLLIQTFPQQLFFMLGMKIFLGTALFGIVCIGISKIVSKINYYKV